MSESAKKPQLVIDANVLIKHADLQALMLQFDLVTVPAVLAEVRDPAARARLATLGSHLKTEAADKQAQDRVAQFAQKTGDFVSLSPADVQIIALAYAKVRDAGKLAFLRHEPTPVSNFKARLEGDATEAGDSEESGDDEERQEEQDGQEVLEREAQKMEGEIRDGEGEKKAQEGSLEKDDAGLAGGDDEDDDNKDDDDGWISVSKPKTEKVHKKPQVKKGTDSDVDKSEALSSNLLSKSMTTDHELDKDHPQMWYENRDFEPNDEEGWITPKNLNNILKGTNVTEGNLIQEVGVGIMTADFAMQVGLLCNY
jgi:hypothetical protein